MKDNASFLREIQQFLLEQQMLQAGDTVCCALSGGADSVCLLRSLLLLQEELQISVTAVHINHQLRGAESDRDAAFCETLCRKWNVPLTIRSCDVTGYAERQHCSTELAARACRYQIFEELPADHIATAHTVSDNLETMLFRLMRGSGLRGLAGIPPVRGRYIRPLLCMTRQRVEAFLDTLEQEFVTDSTNLTEAYERNYIRRQLVPRMKEKHPSLEQTAVGMFSVLRSEQAYLQELAEAAFQRHFVPPAALQGLSEEPVVLQNRCLIQLLEQEQLPYDMVRLERLRLAMQTEGILTLTTDCYAHCGNGGISIFRKSKPEQVQPMPLQTGQQQLYPGFVVEVERLPIENYRKSENVHKKLSKCVLDYDKIKGTVFLRGRIHGEQVQFVGHQHPSSVKKLVQKVLPSERRQTVHCIADAEGTIFVERLGAAVRVQVDEATRTVMQICIRELTAGESTSAKNGYGVSEDLFCERMEWRD